MALTRQDWQFLHDYKVGLRHIGHESQLAGEFERGNIGDAYPLGSAASVIQMERSGVSPDDVFKERHLAAHVRGMRSGLENDLDEFNRAFREKLVALVSHSMEKYSTSADGTASTFMLLRDKDAADNLLPADYREGGYGTLGKSGNSPLDPGKIMAMFRLNDRDLRAIEAGTTTAADAIADRIIDTIPKVRKLVQDMEAEPDPYQRTPAGGADAATVKAGQRAQTELSLQAQMFIEGAIPPEKRAEEARRFVENVGKFAAYDAVMAANFCSTVLNHPGLGELKSAALEGYESTMWRLAAKEPENAMIVAKVHVELYDNNAGMMEALRAIPTLAQALPSDDPGISRREMENWAGKPLRDIKPEERMLATLSLEAHHFADGLVPPDRMAEETERFRGNLAKFIAADPHSATNLCTSLLINPAFGAVAQVAAEAYPKALQAFHKQDPAVAEATAKVHIERYGDVPALAGQARSFLAQPSAPQPTRTRAPGVST